MLQISLMIVHSADDWEEAFANVLCPLGKEGEEKDDVEEESDGSTVNDKMALLWSYHWRTSLFRDLIQLR